MIYGINFSGYSSILEAYHDASWITDTVGRKGTSGYIFTLGRTNVAFRSSNQTAFHDLLQRLD